MPSVHHPLTIFFVIALVALTGLVALAFATRVRSVQEFDDRLETWMITHRERLHVMASIGTLPGERSVHPVIAATTAAIVLSLRAGPAMRVLLPLASASLGGIIVHHLVKFVYHRHRPEGALRRDKTEAAFPSGHTTNATSVIVTSAFILVREGVLPIPVALALAVVVAIITGVSRVALGWHWGTDVIGGWIAGAGVAALACQLYDHLH
ncbi:MAG: phosphatase PAP2 family protein [bacterium]